MLTNFKLYYIVLIHVMYSDNYITLDISYVNHLDICLFGPPLKLVSLDSWSSTEYRRPRVYSNQYKAFMATDKINKITFWFVWRWSLGTGNLFSSKQYTWYWKKKNSLPLSFSSTNSSFTRFKVIKREVKCWNVWKWFQVVYRSMSFTIHVNRMWHK